MKAVADVTSPMTKRQVRSLIGLIGFYCKFEPDYAQVAAPLTDATRKGQPNKTVWGDSHENV